MRQAVFAIIVVLVQGCKPADEPPRRVVDAEVARLAGPDLGVLPEPEVPTTRAPVPVVGEVVRPTVPAEPTTMAPDVIEDVAEDIAPEVEETIEETVEETSEDAPAETVIEEVVPEVAVVVEGLDRVPTADQKEEARARNKAGLELHKKKDYAGARAEYEAALRAWPGHPFSRYNLACAYALEQRADEAVAALAVLAELAKTQTTAADRVAAARLDADFAGLRDDPRFRAVTRATDIVVAFARDGDKTEAKRLTDLLRSARWNAKAAPRAWNAAGLPSAAAILYRADDAQAPSVAPDLASVIDVEMSVQAATSLPPEAPPIVVWLGGGEAPTLENPPPDRPDTIGPQDPTEPPPTEGLTPKELKDFIGLKLYAGTTERHTLELKPTGFFGWEERQASGVRTKRTGRYQVRDQTLALVFKSTAETPVEGASPRIEVHENQTLDVGFSVPEPGVLVVDGKRFRTRPEP